MSSSPAISYINIARVADSTYSSHSLVLLHNSKKKMEQTHSWLPCVLQKLGSWLSWGATFYANLFAATLMNKNHIFFLNSELWVKNCWWKDSHIREMVNKSCLWWQQLNRASSNVIDLVLGVTKSISSILLFSQLFFQNYPTLVTYPTSSSCLTYVATA